MVRNFDVRLSHCELDGGMRTVNPAAGRFIYRSVDVADSSLVNCVRPDSDSVVFLSRGS